MTPLPPGLCLHWIDAHQAYALVVDATYAGALAGAATLACLWPVRTLSLSTDVGKAWAYRLGEKPPINSNAA